MSETAWALDPWTTDEIRFLPVPPEVRTVYVVPEPWAPGIEWDLWNRAPFAASPSTVVTRATEYASPVLMWRGWVFVGPGDERRLLAALHAIEGFLLLVALAAAGAP